MVVRGYESPGVIGLGAGLITSKRSREMKKTRANMVVAPSPAQLRGRELAHVRGGTFTFVIWPNPPKPDGTNWD
jgi:hypothetical protein